MPAERFDEELPTELAAVENALRDLSPSLGQLNRDRLMYLAGQASASLSLGERAGVRVPSHPAPHQIAWPLATAALALVSLTLGGFLIFTQHGGERIVYVDRQFASPVHSNVASGIETNSTIVTVETPRVDPSYFELRNSLLTNGLDALANPQQQKADTDNDNPPQAWPDFRNQLLNDALKS